MRNRLRNALVEDRGRKRLRLRIALKLGAGLTLLAALAVAALVLGSAGGATSSPPLQKVLKDPFADAVGYHGSAEEPSIIAAKNPVRAGDLKNKSTIVGAEQVGRVYDGGASDIGYEISVNGGNTWKSGELPLTIQGGQANTCAGPLSRASDIVVAYDQRHDTWLASTLGLAAGANVPAVYINRGTVNFSTGDMDWGPPICQHITQAVSDSPDKNWVTCDNWPDSKGYGNCYVEWDNNGNGNREIMQYTTDSGLTWIPGPNVSASASGLPGNGNTGDVTGETTLACPTANAACTTGGANAASAGDTNIKVASVAGIGTTLAAASAAGASNVKVTAVTPFFTTTLAAAARPATRRQGGERRRAGRRPDGEHRRGRALGEPDDHRRSAPRARPARASRSTRRSPRPTRAACRSPPPGSRSTSTRARATSAPRSRSVGTAGAAGTGLTLTAPLANAHASGAQVNDAR